jgi:hypothetical protein
MLWRGSNLLLLIISNGENEGDIIINNYYAPQRNTGDPTINNCCDQNEEYRRVS